MQERQRRLPEVPRSQHAFLLSVASSARLSCVRSGEESRPFLSSAFISGTWRIILLRLNLRHAPLAAWKFSSEPAAGHDVEHDCVPARFVPRRPVGEEAHPPTLLQGKHFTRASHARK